MAEHFLDGSDRNPLLKSQCREGMAQDVRRYSLCDLCPVGNLLDDFLHLPFPDEPGGTLSSSDGQRFPVQGKVRNAVALPRYYGYGQGITFYTWSSDQFSQYGTKVAYTQHSYRNYR